MASDSRMRAAAADTGKDMSFPGHRALLRNALPGIVLPGLIYLLASRALPTMAALGAASSVPILDALWRLLRGKPVSGVGVTVVGMTGQSHSDCRRSTPEARRKASMIANPRFQLGLSG